ncbi:uncharacterized protein [Venturia canescens]|uniref:uncharacterized protein isoform X2 n=1 Tax=Venturia canescens TaxID=32260 RepID=UPI001C9CCB64|nr:uncharacterized protein LOC122412233 isoform X2 [Venturia canescens]
MDEKNKVKEKCEKRHSSPSKDDSLADFESPKIKTTVQINKPKILNDKRVKKSSSKNKTAATSRKKDSVATGRRTDNERVQPSIESSFFKASTSSLKSGHTCPLCMKYFADKVAGAAHSKNCASKHNVSTKKLLAAIALQERQAHERIAIGLPAGPFVQPTNKTPRRSRELVVSNVDPDLQLALALSESLQENELEKEFEEALLLAVEHRGEDPIVPITNSQKRQTLKSFGFSTNKPVAPGVFEGPVKSRKKKRLGPTVLQTRTQESRDRLLSERIAEILMGNEAITQASPKINFNNYCKSQTKLQSHLLKKIHQSTKRLWDSAQLSPEVINFYVEDLGPVILSCANGHGRRASNHNENEKDSEMKQAKRDSPEKMEKEVSENNENAAINSPVSSMNCVEETRQDLLIETRNIYVTDRQYRSTLSTDWSNTLNVSSMSDVVILVKNNHIWAHKLVFHVRCSDILLDCESNEDTKFGHVKESVQWLDVDFTIGMAFLEFIYSGVIEKNSQIFNENRMVAGVRRLARKYRLKDLFDYLRKRKTEVSDHSNVENRREGLSSPIIVDANEFHNEVGNHRVTVGQEDHLQRRETPENLTGIVESRQTPVASNETSEIQIENSKPPEINVQYDNPLGNMAVTTTLESSPERSSPRKKLLESPTPKSNVLSQENDADREIETMEVVSISSSHRTSTMSPDLFDETIYETKKEAEEAKNVEATTNVASQVSTEENSNLAVLAQLIAEDDSSSDEGGENFAPPTPLESKIENKAPAVLMESRNECSSDHWSNDFPTFNTSDLPNFNLSNVEDNVFESTEKKKTENSMLSKETNKCKSLSQNHVETLESCDHLPRTSEIEKFSKSQCLPIKQKSNLSLFIEKVQKINSKSASESYTEEDSLGIAVDRRRFRNPFNVKNVSKQLEKSCDEEISDESHENTEEDSEHENAKANLDKSSINESSRFEDNNEINSIDETSSTCDEDVSMYSKYRKKNQHDNSIANYRNMLKATNKPRGETTRDEKNESEISTHGVPIDLTQESDEDVEFPPSSSSSVNPRISRKPINRILDTDSNDSLLIKKDCQVQSTIVIENKDLNVSKGCISDQNNESRKKSPSSYHDEENGLKNSLFSSDLDVFEIDEELLSNSNIFPERVAGPSSKNCSPLSGKSTPRMQSYNESVNLEGIKSTEKKEKRSNHFAATSSEDTRSPNSYYQDSGGLEINEEIFTQSLLNSKNLVTENEDELSTDKEGKASGDSSPEPPCFDSFKRNAQIFTQSSKNVDISSQTTASPSSDDEIYSSRKSRRSKKRSKKRRSSDTSVSSSDFEKRKDRKKSCTHEISPELNHSQISPEVPESDYCHRNDEIFTQSLKNQDEHSRAESPLSDKETLRVRSPIILSSSPEPNLNFGELSMNNTGALNKENSQENNKSPGHSQKSEENFFDRFSPIHFEELHSPEPCTSRQRYSPCFDYDSSNSVRKLMSRSVSMPERTSVGKNNHGRQKTPQKKSRMTVSQELTPPRNYDEMDTPELKQELDKYGIKPQKRKRARQLLKHIYNELHQKVPATSPATNALDNSVEEDDDEEPPPKRTGRISAHTLSDSESDRDIALSQESLLSSGSSIIPEEVEFPEVNGSPKAVAEPISIKKAFVELMKTDKKLHAQVLTYDPLPFETLYSTLKAQGLKCKQNDLMDFLDEECITFQVLAQSGKSRTRKNHGKTGSKWKDKNRDKNKAAESRT